MDTYEAEFVIISQGNNVVEEYIHILRARGKMEGN